MSQKMSTASLIKHYRMLAGLNQSQLARRIGVKPQTVQYWEQADKPPKHASMEQVAQALGVEPRDLAVGAPLREPTPVPLTHSERVVTRTVSYAVPASMPVPAVTAPPPTGGYRGVEISRLPTNGGYVTDIEAIVVSPDWVARRLPGRDPRQIRVIEAYGDAMAPTLAEGDWVLVDTAKRELNFDAVWVLRQRNTGEIWIRRVQRRPDGSWALLSDNDRYPAVIVPADQRQQFDVLGQAALRNNLAMM